MSQVDINILRDQVDDRLNELGSKTYLNEFDDSVAYISPEHSAQLERLMSQKGAKEQAGLTQAMQLLTTIEFRASVQYVFNNLTEEQREANPMPEAGIDQEREVLGKFKKTITSLPKPEHEVASLESSTKGVSPAAVVTGQTH